MILAEFSPFLFLSRSCLVAPLRVQLNAVPSTHIRCMITASRRATATWARSLPRRRVTSTPQRFSQLQRLHPRQQHIRRLRQQARAPSGLRTW